MRNGVAVFKYLLLFLYPRKLGILLLTKTASWWNDKSYLKMLYWLKMKKKLNLTYPKTFNEKLQWLKLYNRKPEYTLMVDKYEVKKYVASRIGTQHIIPTLGIYNRVEDIDFDALPQKFVLKCTHDSGGIIICKDKAMLNIDIVRQYFLKALKRDFYLLAREWPYKNVEKRVIAEKYMVDESQVELKDYKFFCFNGEPKFLFVASDRPHDTRFDFFDLDFNHLPFTNGHPHSSKEIKKPKGFEVMISLAKKLAKGIPHVRIDFYDIDGNVYFGEYTFFHHSGLEAFDPEEWDYTLGEMIDITLVK